METITINTDIEKSKEMVYTCDICPHKGNLMCCHNCHSFFMKSYTDLEQSKKLVEILPLESADMYYALSEDESMNMINFGKPQGFFDKTQVAWSLAALLDVLPDTIDGIESYCRLTTNKEGDIYNISYDDILSEESIILYAEYSLIDACYEMILKLNELKML